MSSKTFTEAVTDVLAAAGIPPVKIEDVIDDPDNDWRVAASGYTIHGGLKYADVAIIGRDGIPDSARHAERDGILQAAHHALLQTGYKVTVNEHGTLHVTKED
jgi:ABC-type sugar transport system substrate-binding protein